MREKIRKRTSLGVLRKNANKKPSVTGVGEVTRGLSYLLLFLLVLLELRIFLTMKQSIHENKHTYIYTQCNG